MCSAADWVAALLHLSAQPARSKAHHMTACPAHRPNHMEEMITGQEIAAHGQRKQSFCTGLSQSCPLSQLAAWPLAWPPSFPLSVRPPYTSSALILLYVFQTHSKRTEQCNNAFSAQGHCFVYILCAHQQSNVTFNQIATEAWSGHAFIYLIFLCSPEYIFSRSQDNKTNKLEMCLRFPSHSRWQPADEHLSVIIRYPW